jgi:hypothetical protein
MISTCANPACNKPFHYLRGGRLYRFDVASPREHADDVSNTISAMSPNRMAVFFWLCKQCSSRMSLKFNGRQAFVIPVDSPTRGLGRTPVVAVGEYEADERHLASDLRPQPGH